MPEDLLVYGSYGYTGSLVVEAAVDAGLEPILAGRRAEPLEKQATAHDLPHRVFTLDRPGIVADQVREVDAVLHCAGPFSTTARPMVRACLATGTDYLDLAGEIDVLEGMAGRHDRARDAGATLLPAVGFDVVPTDCLAAYLAGQVDAPTHLTLAMDGFASYSPGTVKSIVDGLDRPGAVRADGAVRSVPAAWKVREFDFGDGPKPAVTVPWGDVSTAYHATDVPNVETYATLPGPAIAALRRGRPLLPLLGSRPVRWALERLADAVVSGPTAGERSRRSVRVRGEVQRADPAGDESGHGAVEDGPGESAAALLRTPDPYDLTAETAVESARRVLAGEVAAGFHTPATAFGPEFALDFDGVRRQDLPAGRARPAAGE